MLEVSHIRVTLEGLTTQDTSQDQALQYKYGDVWFLIGPEDRVKMVKGREACSSLGGLEHAIFILSIYGNRHHPN